MEETLKNKVAIVTGSSSGYGEAIALAFAARGASVTLCGRDNERLQLVLGRAADASGGHTERFITVQGDLNQATVREEVINQTVEVFGRVDILVANAGVASACISIHDATEETYDFVMDTNLKSVFFLIQLAVPHLEKTRGNIVNISSSHANMLVPSRVVYSLSKVGLDHLTACLAVDLGSRGIRVNGVNPGFTATRIGRAYGDQAQEMYAMFQQAARTKVPLSGRELSVQDVAEAVTFLASEAAGFITGVNLKVEGGRTLVGA